MDISLDLGPVDDFQITPPPSPTPVEKALRLQANKKNTKPRDENFSDYQDRITEGKFFVMRQEADDAVNSITVN